MPRKSTGNVRWTGNGYSARIRLAPGKGGRPSFELARMSEAAADERGELLAILAARLRPVASRDEIEILLEEAGRASTPQALAKVQAIVEARISGDAKNIASAKPPSFEDFAADWTSGRLHKKHPDHVREKDSTRDKEALRLYINPVIGPTRIPDVNLEHAERVMSRLPSRLAPRTRKLIAQCMRKVLSLAVYPGRYIAANPIPLEWMPKIPKSANKAKTLLYPSEDAKLLGCGEVKIERRLVYGILSREGMRASELELLKWRDVDLELGRVRLDENKTDDPRAWALSPDVARALAWWKKHTGAEGDDLVIGLDLGDAAWWLRGDDKKPEKYPGDLRTAGVTRRELFERSKVRQPIRVHDLRATFVTVNLANGRSETWVTDRTGHKSSAMIALYTRQARQWSELSLGTLGALDELLPEVPRKAPAPPPEQAPETPTGAPDAPAATAGAPSGQPIGPASGQDLSHPRELNPRPTVYEGEHESSGFTANREFGSIVDPRAPEVGRAEGPLAQSRPVGRTAELEAAIANFARLLAVTDDPNVAAELVSERRAMRAELEELRQRTSGSVIDLNSRRPPRRP